MDNAKIVKLYVSSHSHYNLLHLVSDTIGQFIIQAYRIHMNHSATIKFVGKTMLDYINHIMQNKNIPCGRHFHMDRKHHSPRSIIMYHQIVQS